MKIQNYDYRPGRIETTGMHYTDSEGRKCVLNRDTVTFVRYIEPKKDAINPFFGFLTGEKGYLHHLHGASVKLRDVPKAIADLIRWNRSIRQKHLPALTPWKEVDIMRGSDGFKDDEHTVFRVQLAKTKSRDPETALAVLNCDIMIVSKPGLPDMPVEPDEVQAIKSYLTEYTAREFEKE